jgi:hypothetical protein
VSVLLVRAPHSRSAGQGLARRVARATLRTVR